VFVSEYNLEAKHEYEDKCPKSHYGCVYDVDTQGVC